MNAKVTLFLFVCAVGLLAFIWFYERHQPGTDTAREQAQYLLAVDREEIDQVLIERDDDQTLLRRVGYDWRILEPMEDRADSQSLDRLFTALEMMRIAGRIPPAELRAGALDMEEAGLMEPGERIRITTRDQVIDLEFGAPAAQEGRRYVRVAGDETVYLVNEEAPFLAFQPPEFFRDQRLMPISAGAIAAVEVDNDNGSLELRREHDVWTLAKPLKARADQGRIDDYLAELVNARIQEFVTADPELLAAVGLDEIRGTLFFRDDLGEQVAVLEIGAVSEEDPTMVYVHLPDRDVVALAPVGVATLLESDPGDLRDRRLLVLEEDLLDRVTIEDPESTTTLHRSEAGWDILELEARASATTVEAFLNSIQAEEVSQFVANSAADLEAYGLEEPQLRVVFSSFASENVPEAGAGEHPFLTLELGVPDETGRQVYARLVEEPYIVSVDAALLEEISARPAAWQSLGIFEFEPDMFRRLSLMHDEETTVLEWDEEEGWQVEEGEGEINPPELESLLTALGGLRAVQWLGVDPEDAGLDEPTFRLAFHVADLDEEFEVVLGEQDEFGYWLAATDVRPGVFMISGPDAELLTLKPLRPADEIELEAEEAGEDSDPAGEEAEEEVEEEDPEAAEDDEEAETSDDS